MILEKREILMNSVCHAQFNYCQSKNKMKYKKTRKDGSVSVLHRNIHSHLHSSPQVVTDIFTQTMQQYNFRIHFRIPSVNTVYHGSENMSYSATPPSQILEIIPLKIKEINSFNSFQKKKKNQKVGITILLKGKNISVNGSLRKL